MYYFFHVLSFIGVALYIVLWAPKYSFNPIRALVHIGLTIATAYLSMMLLFYLVTGHFGGKNIERIFIFVPPIAMLYGKVLNMQPDKILDLYAPAPCIVLGIASFGCVFGECCRSWLKVDWGIYNSVVNEKIFPLPIFQAITGLVIAAIVWWMARKKDYDAHGRTMAWALFLFGITRFGWEFLRDNEKLFLGLSEFSLWAIITAVVGLVWIVWTADIEEETPPETEETSQEAEAETVEQT